jgi:acetylglutamate kinase
MPSFPGRAIAGREPEPLFLVHGDRPPPTDRLAAAGERLELQEAIEKADVLIEALGWIRRFRDKTTVIKLGGSAMEDQDALRHILLDLVFMETVGMRPIVVHGGGAPISRAMDQAGLKPQFIMGRRYTDPATLAIVKRVLGQEICTSLARRIEQLGGAATPLNFDTRQVLFGRRIRLTTETGEERDLGLVGEVTRVDNDTILDVCRQGRIPVIPSLCEEEGTGQLLNVNADTAATAIAQSLGAEKLVYVSDVNGVRRDKDDPNTHIQSLTASEARELIRSGVIHSGMIPKVEACLETLERGVKKVHIIDGGLRHSLLLEIYTTQGVGTEIVADR